MRQFFTRFVLVLALALGGSSMTNAQEAGVWLQVEAQPTLSAAQERVRAYAAQFQDVSGYYLGSGWYGIALGPYSAADADSLLRDLLARRVIPADSYISDGSTFQQQFWPIGVGSLTAPQSLPNLPTSTGQTATTDVIAAPLPPVEEPVVVEPTPEIPDETSREAQASEELLSGPQKQQLQIALQWAGFYDGAIDGAYGRGTRNSMGAWQEANAYEVTGILTTRQRAALMGAYNAVLNGLGLQLVRDDATGIELQIPTEVVAFNSYEPPFARFTAKGDLDATVLLISQQGDQTRLFGLYEILQTLEIMPPNGPRDRSDSSFEIEGVNGRTHSYIYAALTDGQIKGFALIWPAGDEERRTRLLAEMKASFTPIPGVLDPGIAAPGEDQAVDLISGLEVRQPILSRSGFFIDAGGTVLTTTEVLGNCGYLTIDDDHVASVAYRDDVLGLAVLRPETPLAPIGIAAFQTGVPRLQAEVAVSGYPYGGVLAMPALTFGRLADLRGLNGEEAVKRLDMVAQPGDAGGPVFDNGGAVLGMLLPRVDLNGQVLPPEVSFSVDAPAIIVSLTTAGVTVQTTDQVSFMPPETLTREAPKMTVLVSCWE